MWTRTAVFLLSLLFFLCTQTSSIFLASVSAFLQPSLPHSLTVSLSLSPTLGGGDGFGDAGVADSDGFWLMQLLVFNPSQSEEAKVFPISSS